MAHITDHILDKSNKEVGVFYHIKNENIDMYNFLKPKKILKDTHIANKKRVTTKDNNVKRQDVNNEKERNYILNEISFYCSLSNYTPYNIYNKINTITGTRIKYDIPYINKCSLCKMNNKVHSINYYKSMKVNNTPVIFMTPGDATDTSQYYVIQHLIIEFDKCMEYVNIETNINKFSIIFNFENYTLDKMVKDMKLAYNLSLIIQDLYYERLEYIYLIDAPLFIAPMLSMMKKMFKNSIYKKIIRITKQKFENILN